MKTQVSILVKNESLLSRSQSFLWFINIFKKMSVDMYVDDAEATPQRLKARKEPYVFDMEPGSHAIMFTDPRAQSKVWYKGLTNAFIGMTISGASGGSMLGGAAMGFESADDGIIQDSIAQFTLQEGDLLKMSVKPKHNGNVKIKFLKK